MKEVMSSSKPLLAMAVSPGSRASAGAVAFRIVAFPKEFQKNYWHAMDRRMLLIFCFSLTLFYGTLISMALRPRHQFTGTRLDDATLRKLGQVLKVSPVVIDPPDAPQDIVKENSDNSMVTFRHSDHVPKGNINKAYKLAAARDAANKRAEQARIKAGKGYLVAATSDNSTGTTRYTALDIQGTSTNLDNILEQISSLSDATENDKKTSLGKRFAGNAGEIAALVTELESSDGISTFAGDAGGSLIVGKANIATGNGTTVSARDIQAVIDEHAAVVNSCYQKELKKSPDLKGKLSVQIKVNPAGHVSGVTVATNSVGDAVMRCVENKIRGWEFPKGKKGIVTVNQTFVFTR